MEKYDHEIGMALWGKTGEAKRSGVGLEGDVRVHKGKGNAGKGGRSITKIRISTRPRRENFPDSTQRSPVRPHKARRASPSRCTAGSIREAQEPERQLSSYQPPQLIPKTPSPFDASSPHPRYYSSRVKCFLDYTTLAILASA